MEIQKNDVFLKANSSIFFDVDVFCGRPYVYLVAFKEKNIYGWESYSIGIAVRDMDDFDKGIIYQANKENFETILHELLNWMVDHEKGISYTSTLLDKSFSFFPQLDCQTSIW